MVPQTDRKPRSKLLAQYPRRVDYEMHDQMMMDDHDPNVIRSDV